MTGKITSLNDETLSFAIEKEAEELPHESIDNMCGSYPPPKQQQEPQQIPPDDRRPKAATKRSQNSFRTVEDNSDPSSTVILTKHEVQPFYIVDPDGSFRQITEILVPNESRSTRTEPVHHNMVCGSPVEHFTEENTHEVTYELIPMQDEPDQRRLKNDKDEKVMKTITKLGNSKEQKFVPLDDIKEAIEYVKKRNLVVNEEVIELKVFPAQQSSQKTSDQKHPCRVCEALGQDRKFKTADSMNKHLRSHFYQLLNKQCKFCKKSSFPRIDNHQNICPMNPKNKTTDDDSN